MSLLSRERIVIGLAPERLTALWVGGWLRPRLLDRHAVLLPPQGTAGWEAGIATLESLFSETAWRGRDVAVILSAHYVRHVLVPPGRGIGEDERTALAAAVFQETFGDLARDWELRVSPAAGDAPTLACGVPRALLAALRTACQGRGRLVSVQPSLMPVFKRVRQAIGKAAGCVALVETGRITIASVENGHWNYVDSRAGDGGILPQFLLEEGVVHGRQPGGILWLCDLTNSARLPAGTFWSHQPVEPPHLPGMDPGLSLATWGLA